MYCLSLCEQHIDSPMLVAYELVRRCVRSCATRAFLRDDLLAQCLQEVSRPHVPDTAQQPTCLRAERGDTRHRKGAGHHTHVESVSMKRGISNRTKRRTAMEGSMTMLQIFMNPSSTSRTISDEWAFPRADTICSLYMLLNTLDSPEAQERGQLSSLRHHQPRPRTTYQMRWSAWVRTSS
jgi:hypothetical protein